MLNKTMFAISRFFVYQFLLILAIFFSTTTISLAQTVTINGGQSQAMFCANDGGMIESNYDIPCNTDLEVTYQWQLLMPGNNDWIDITLGNSSGVFIGFDSQTLELLANDPDILFQFNGSSIRLIIDYNCDLDSDFEISNIITLNIDNPDIPPIPSATPSGIVCPGTEVTLSVDNDNLGGEFSWYTNGNFIESGFSIQVTPTETTTYNVRREINNCFSSSRGIQISVGNVSVSAITNIQSNEAEPCEGQEVTLTASGGTGASNTIKWYSVSNGGGQLLHTGNMYSVPATNTTFYVRRENGCGDDTEDFDFLLETQNAPQAVLLNTPQDVCVGIPFVFQANTSGNPDNTIYSWIFPGGSPPNATGSEPINVSFNTPNDNQTITLIARLSDNNACQSTVNPSFSVVDKPSLEINDNTINSNGQVEFEIAANTNANLLLTSNLEDATFDWSFIVTNGSIEGTAGSGQGALINEKWTLPDEVESAELEGTIIVSNGGCTEIYMIKIILQQLLFVPNILSVNGDGINECWSINLLKNTGFFETDFDIKLYSRTGKCARGCNESFTLAEAIEWCGEGCSAGAYFYQITGPEGYEKLGSLTIVK